MPHTMLHSRGLCLTPYLKSCMGGFNALLRPSIGARVSNKARREKSWPGMHLLIGFGSSQSL